MPWRRCRQIKHTCYNTRVCANASAVNESYHACDNDDNDGHDDDDDDDDVFLVTRQTLKLSCNRLY